MKLFLLGIGALGVIVCTNTCPYDLVCLTGRCVAKCNTTDDCEKTWNRPKNTFECSVYCYTKCLFDIDCDMSNGETCMGNVCRIRCSEDSDCRWSKIQEIKQCDNVTNQCFWPCIGTAKAGEVCAPDGIYRKPCTDCQQPMMCQANYCFDICNDAISCASITTSPGGQTIQPICMNDNCQRYCISDSNCKGRKLCSTIGICAYRCRDTACGNVTKCAPDGGCRDLPTLPTGKCPIESQVVVDGFCYDKFDTTRFNSSGCPPDQNNYKGICKYVCTSNSDCDPSYRCQELTGVCIQDQLLAGPIALNNCWKQGTFLTVEYQSGISCVSLVPTHDILCAANLPKSLMLELNVSTYKRSIQSLLYNYNYSNTTQICVTCPADDILECREALRATEAAVIALITPTHSAIETVDYMKTMTVNFETCYSDLKSTVRVINPNYHPSTANSDSSYSVCAALHLMNLCPSLAEYQIKSMTLTIMSHNKIDVISLDKSFFNPNSGMYCYSLGKLANQTAREQVTRYLSDPWTHGNFTLISEVNGIEVEIKVNLNFMSTAFLANCYSQVIVYLNPDMVFVELTPNSKAINSGHCESPAGTNYINIVLLLLDLNTSTKLLLEYNISTFSLSNITNLFFYPNGSYNNFNGIIYPSVSKTSTDKKVTPMMQRLREFYNIVATDSGIIQSSLLMNFWRSGETTQSGSAKYFADRIEASCFNYTTASVGDDNICISLTPAVSPTCGLQYLPSPGKTSVESSSSFIKNLTLEVFNAKNLSVRTGMFQKFSTFSLNATEYCFDCTNYVLGSSTDPDLNIALSATELCTNLLVEIWKNRAQQIIGFRARPNITIETNFTSLPATVQTDPSYRSSFITMTSIQSRNYLLVYIITFSISGCFVVGNIIYGIIILRKVRAEMIILTKLRKKQMRRNAKEALRKKANANAL